MGLPLRGVWYPYTWSDQVEPQTLPVGAWSTEVPVDTAAGGCVNMRSAPGEDAAVVRCLNGADYVMPAASNHSPWYPPAWTGGAIWWYVFLDDPANSGPTPLGWMDADYLICGDGPHSLNTSCKQSASQAGYGSAQAAADAAARTSGEVSDPRTYPGQEVVTGTATAVFRYEAGPDGEGAALPGLRR